MSGRASTSSMCDRAALRLLPITSATTWVARVAAGRVPIVRSARRPQVVDRPDAQGRDGLGIGAVEIARATSSGRPARGERRAPVRVMWPPTSRRFGTEAIPRDRPASVRVAGPPIGLVVQGSPVTLAERGSTTEGRSARNTGRAARRSATTGGSAGGRGRAGRAVVASGAMAAPDIRPIRIPDPFTVFAASDIHGQLGAVDRLLGRRRACPMARTAGSRPKERRWSSPATSSTVGPTRCGSSGASPRCGARHRATAGSSRSSKATTRCRSSAGLAGQPEIFGALMAFGVGPRCNPWGSARRKGGRSSAEIAARVDDLAPTSCRRCGRSPVRRWGDVLFVHARPCRSRSWTGSNEAPIACGSAMGSTRRRSPSLQRTAGRLSPAGIRRVMLGHTPVERPP